LDFFVQSCTVPSGRKTADRVTQREKESAVDEPKRVEFQTIDGVTLRGDFYKADGDGVPGIVMSPGWTILKEVGLPGLAKVFQAAGISALAYDHRWFGSSDGMPRQHSDPLQHAEDYHDAVTAMRHMPGVDPDRVVMHGIGHSAGFVMMAAAVDPRIAAAIFHRPIFGGTRASAPWADDLLERAWADREEKTMAKDPDPTYVPIWPKDEDDMGVGPLIPGPAAWALYSGGKPGSEAAGTPYENQATLQSAYLLSKTEVENDLGKVTVPCLYMPSPDDPFGQPLDEQKKASERMGPNGEYKVLEPAGDRPLEDAFVDEVNAQVEFLDRVLPGGLG
jgi:uncharacterized protein